LKRGADPLTVIEADRRLVRFLRASLDPGDAEVRYVVGPFERARLAEATFDLGVAASSFHWVPARYGLRRVARALRPGGWFAHWNNHHGDPARTSRFDRDLGDLYRQLRRGGRSSGPPRRTTRRPADRSDGAEQIALLRSTKAFDRIRREEIRWSVTLPTERIVNLWATFSDTATLPAPKRRWFLTELGRRVDEGYGGRVVLPILTPVYTARRL
jgi:SAM-dependent methyltransferase